MGSGQLIYRIGLPAHIHNGAIPGTPIIGFPALRLAVDVDPESMALGVDNESRSKLK